jgi:hypothetical protein
LAEKRQRAPMKATSEAMRRWSEALGREVEGWPGVTVKAAFGMTLVYRNGVVFTALPRTRALYEEDAILLKFHAEPKALVTRMTAEERFAAGTMERRRGARTKSTGEGHKWKIFLMREDADVHAAIEWLAEAYRVAGKRSGTT